MGSQRHKYSFAFISSPSWDISLNQCPALHMQIYLLTYMQVVGYMAVRGICKSYWPESEQHTAHFSRYWWVMIYTFQPGKSFQFSRKAIRSLLVPGWWEFPEGLTLSLEQSFSYYLPYWPTFGTSDQVLSHFQYHDRRPCCYKLCFKELNLTHYCVSEKSRLG